MRDYQRGQILLIVVLVMVTALTIGLSVAARTITNVRTSQEAENSEKAFSAAEAGIEQSLTHNSSTNGSFSNNTTYKTTVNQISGTQFTLNNGSAVFKDDAIDVWLSTYPNYANPWTGNITLYWGDSSDTCSQTEGTNTISALEVVAVTGNKANPYVTRYAFDPCSQRSLDNKFTFISSGGGVVAGKTYSYRRTLSITSGLFVRIIPLYGPTTLAVTGCDSANANCSALPSQGTVIEATGTSDNTSRKLVSYRSYPKIPTELFPYSLFSPQ